MADWEIQDGIQAGRKSRKFCLLKIWVPVINDRNKTNCFQVFHAVIMISDEMYAFELIFAIKWVT